jgi:hypothetical protein
MWSRLNCTRPRSAHFLVGQFVGTLHNREGIVRQWRVGEDIEASDQFDPLGVVNQPQISKFRVLQWGPSREMLRLS